MTASPVEAREVTVAGRHLRCQVCEFTRFYRREVRMSTGASQFGQDWATSRAECLICEQCGYVHWFAAARSRDAVGDRAMADEIEDLRRRLETELNENLEPTPR